MVTLSQLVRFREFFEKCRRLNKRNPGRFEFHFHLVNQDERTRRDLVQGLTDVLVSSDRIRFTGMTFKYPRVMVKFADIRSIKLTRAGDKTLVFLEAEAKVTYREWRGPDL